MTLRACMLLQFPWRGSSLIHLLLHPFIQHLAEHNRTPLGNDDPDKTPAPTKVTPSEGRQTGNQQTKYRLNFFLMWLKCSKRNKYNRVVTTGKRNHYRWEGEGWPLRGGNVCTESRRKGKSQSCNKLGGANGKCKGLEVIIQMTAGTLKKVIKLTWGH